jgi:hypothetical protein
VLLYIGFNVGNLRQGRPQSALPPNWQGAILVLRSAEMVSVVWAKIQSRGLFGGLANWRISAALMSSFSKSCRKAIKSFKQRLKVSVGHCL